MRSIASHWKEMTSQHVFLWFNVMLAMSLSGSHNGKGDKRKRNRLRVVVMSTVVTSLP